MLVLMRTFCRTSSSIFDTDLINAVSLLTSFEYK